MLKPGGCGLVNGGNQFWFSEVNKKVNNTENMSNRRLYFYRGKQRIFNMLFPGFIIID